MRASMIAVALLGRLVGGLEGCITIGGRIICYEGYEPSPSPSAKPSPLPTPTPTRAPTPAPTSQFAPTGAPTPRPSPTPSQSMAPTPRPSTEVEPTPPPSTAPMSTGPATPSPAPTLSPTYAPTVEPTLDPTPAPSRPPTYRPTMALYRPTYQPTKLSPTYLPTPQPTTVPLTLSPPADEKTLTLTDLPTYRPTEAEQGAYSPTGADSAGKAACYQEGSAGPFYTCDDGAKGDPTVIYELPDEFQNHCKDETSLADCLAVACSNPSDVPQTVEIDCLPCEFFDCDCDCDCDDGVCNDRLSVGSVEKRADKFLHQRRLLQDHRLQRPTRRLRG